MKKYLKLSQILFLILGLALTSVVFLGQKQIAYARVDQQPELYRTHTYHTAFYTQIQNPQYLHYPLGDKTASVFFNQPHVLRLTKPGTGIGFYSPVFEQNEAMDGYLYEVEIDAGRNADRPIYFYTDYANELNYKSFSCWHGVCEFQQFLNGHPLYPEPPMSPQIQLPETLTGALLVKVFSSSYLSQITICPRAGSDYDCSFGPNLSVELDPSQHASQRGHLVLWHYWPEDYQNNAGVFDQAYYDVKITSFQLKSDLISQVYRQNDYRWRSEQLGSGPRTIGSHGCALTSATMVLNYWGHNSYGGQYSGNLITPAYLNNWLKNQKDGYFSQDSLNWSAVTRFARENRKLTLQSDGQNLPNLEFVSFGEHEAEHYFHEDLNQGWPSIFRTRQQNSAGTHFMVGINEAGGDPDQPGEIRIADPYFSAYRYLSDQTNQFGSMNGLRRFQPSYTDLSYLWFYSPSPNLEFILTNLGVENPQNTAQAFAKINDQISEPISGEAQPELYKYFIAKPESGHYQISVTNQGPVGTFYQAAFYDIDADLSWWDDEPRQILAQEIQYLELNYQKEKPEPSSVFDAPLPAPASLALTPEPLYIPPQTWNDFRILLDRGEGKNQIINFIKNYFYQLTVLAEENEKYGADLTNRSRYISYFENSLRLFFQYDRNNQPEQRFWSFLHQDQKEILIDWLEKFRLSI